MIRAAFREMVMRKAIAKGRPMLAEYCARFCRSADTATRRQKQHASTSSIAIVRLFAGDSGQPMS